MWVYKGIRYEFFLSIRWVLVKFLYFCIAFHSSRRRFQSCDIFEIFSFFCLCHNEFLPKFAFSYFCISFYSEQYSLASSTFFAFKLFYRLWLYILEEENCANSCNFVTTQRFCCYILLVSSLATILQFSAPTFLFLLISFTIMLSCNSVFVIKYITM